MYRSIANFGIWATSLDSSEPSLPRSTTMLTVGSFDENPKITVTGKIPRFEENMIRQRISTKGMIREMEPPEEIPALNIPTNEIGVINAVPTQRWLNAKEKWDRRYAKRKRRIQVLRAKEYVEAQKTGFLGGELAGEVPPPSALAGRPSVQMAMEGHQTVERRRTKNLAAGVWSRIGWKEDKVNEIGKDKKTEDEDGG
jgi:hypothetical protein